MDRYDLIALDMDGTLLTDEQVISAATKAAIDKAVSYGKTVVLSTGRTPAEILDYERELENIRYYICENGALIYDSEKECIIDSQSIPKETADELMKIAETWNVMIYIASNGRAMFTYSDLARMEQFHIDQYRDVITRTGLLHDNMIESYWNKPFPIEKINFFSVSPERREVLKEVLAKYPVTAVYAEETSIEVSPLHMSKAVGLQKLCDFLSISLDRTIVVGDSDNDAEILKKAGLSAAMGNARSYIKELCDTVVADNNHDGCAEAIERYLLGSKDYR